MAEVFTDSILSKSKFHNWIKAQIALLITKEAIEPIVVSEILHFQQEYLLYIATSNNLTVRTCSDCRTENVVQCSRSGVCNITQGRCSYHRDSQTKFRLCPNNICHNFTDIIRRHHRYSVPCFKNTDAKQWCNNPWEIAKCYMPPKGYEHVTNAAGTDFNGLLSIIINHKGFEKYCSDELSMWNNIFTEGRSVGNAVRHSHNLEVEDANVAAYFGTLSSILTKLEFKEETTSLKNALQKLKQLQTDELMIGENIISKIIQDTLQDTQDRTNNEMIELKKQNENLLHFFEHHMKRLCDSVNHVNFTIKSTSDRVEGIVQELFHVMKQIQEERTQINRETKPGCRTTHVAEEIIPDRVNGGETQQRQNTSMQLHDGKLIKLSDTQVQNLLQNVDRSLIAEGGFGKVYPSKEVVSGLDIPVVLKELKCNRNDHAKILTTFNEKISRRVMHFAIVPLIGYMEKDIASSERVYYFLSPYLNGGSLRSNLSKDFEAPQHSNAKLTWRCRIEILFQIASAIKYLHTAVAGYRGIVFHMDITSSNIVLDENRNARLIDFGLSRELKEGQINVSNPQSKILGGTDGYLRTYSHSKLTVREDCYNFGVRKAPYISRENNPPDELRKQGKDYISQILQKNVWNPQAKQSSEAAEVLNDLSEQCLKSNYHSQKIVDAIKRIRGTVIKLFNGCKEGKCFICMVNSSVKKGLSQHSCIIQVCLSCMRNSNLNPIICPTCGETVMPEIGHTFAAILIAGNDVKCKEYAESCCGDVTEIKDVLSSKYPCVIGISEDNIEVVAPSNPGQNDNLLPEISNAFKHLEKKKKDISTLMFYYTGHYSSEDGFQLGNENEFLKLKQLQEFLTVFSQKRPEVKRIIAFLDCCYAPKIGNIPDLCNKGVKIMQLNVCPPTSRAYQRLDGSLFRKFFVQALTRKFFNKHCLTKDDRSACKLCEISGDFITIGKMHEYIETHINEICGDRDLHLISDVDVTKFSEVCFGYNIDFSATFEFKFQVGSEEPITVNIEQGVFCQLSKLKLSILRSLQNLKGKGLMLPSADYVDCLSLQIYDGRQNGEELQTMLQIMAAMDTGQCVIASLRKSASILHGKVALFHPIEELNAYLKKYSHKIEPIGNAEIATLSKEELNRVMKYLNEHDDLRDMNKDLLEVFKEWSERDNKNINQLTISFLKPEDNSSPPFIVLELHRHEISNTTESPIREETLNTFEDSNRDERPPRDEKADRDHNISRNENPDDDRKPNTDYRPNRGENSNRDERPRTDEKPDSDHHLNRDENPRNENRSVNPTDETQTAITVPTDMKIERD